MKKIRGNARFLLYTDECKRNIEREVPNLTNNLKVRADAPALAMVQSTLFKQISAALSALTY